MIRRAWSELHDELVERMAFGILVVASTVLLWVMLPRPKLQKPVDHDV